MAYAVPVRQSPARDVHIAVRVVYNLDKLVLPTVADAIPIRIACEIAGRIGKDLIDDQGGRRQRHDDVIIVAGLDLEGAIAHSPAGQ